MMPFSTTYPPSSRLQVTPGIHSYSCRLSAASRTSPMVEMDRQSRIPENFICSSLSILPIFSARQLISWNQPSAGRYCSRPGMGDSTLVIRKGMLLFPSCPLVRESIFCSGFSLPESGKVSKTRLTGLMVFSYRIFMTGSLSSTIDSSPSCHCQAAIPSPSRPSQVLLFL